MKENNTYQIIKNLVEKNGNKRRAALKIGCTVRNINLLIKKLDNTLNIDIKKSRTTLFNLSIKTTS